MITDCHIHSFAKTEAPQTGAYVPPARDIRDYMDEAAPLGARRAVVVQASVDGTDNSRLVEVLGTDGPVALRGVAMIDADADLQALHAAGIRATRIQDRARLGDSALDQLPDLAKHVAEVGWHIELNTEPRSFDRLADMVADLPEGLRLVLDHMGHVDPAAPAPLFRLLETGRVWAKLSPTRVSTDIGPYGDLSALIERLGAAFPDQIIWGSDWPHVMTPEPVPEIPPMLELCREALSQDSFTRCMWGNPERLYGF
ncbi:amidohydrolase family protein [Sagittula stellata]|uniref:Putative 2-pyrone-4,6-dicarbaxylate hydrolase n=1 Tax=Sagittula stellata (strain ATCC 700073 / DSM 11524 / E-37) TaxID=388399 RepID=A3JY85_SAGS3|nr:amidohydrolase family protein [Sagittula stellata]EBA10471.1 putative 2-pyrone-4,6-dicarbaxylate hydrolase [Sagittula stellata E-37]